MAKRPNFRLDHPYGYRSELYFDPDMVAAAKRGNSRMQQIICIRFKNDAVAKWKAGRYKTEPPHFFVWNHISIRPLPQTLLAGTVPRQYQPVEEAPLAKNDRRPDVGEGGCGCNCGGCDIDQHCYKRSQGCKK